MLRVFQTETAEHYAEARRLFNEYADWLGVDLEFQHFAEEVTTLPGPYGPPSGCLLLASDHGQVAGCVALQKLEDHICEMKRLYVRPSFRRRGIGNLLARKVIEMARTMGYQRMRLDTLRSGLEPARALYRSLGFREIAPYYDNPLDGVEYLELLLTD